jgi:hypothetical protein
MRTIHKLETKDTIGGFQVSPALILCLHMIRLV